MTIYSVLFGVCSYTLHGQTIDLDEMESLNHGESDCSEVRLDRNGGPTANIPTRDQGQVGSCTAHAAAILIDAHLAKKYPAPSLKSPPMNLTSPFALYVNEKINSNFTGAFDGNAGSDIPNMIKAARTAGSCDLSDTTYDHEAFENLINLMQAYDTTITRIAELSTPGRVLNPEEQAEKTRNSNLRSPAVAMIVCLMEKFFGLPRGTGNIVKAAKFLDVHLQSKVWNEFLNERCVVPSTKIPPAEIGLPKLEVISRLKGPNQPAHANKTVADLQRAIDRNLTQKRQPVGIGYCSSFLGKTYPNINHGVDTFQKISNGKTQEARDKARADCGMHASVIVGRQWRYASNGTRQCMYLVHNSWGTGVAGCMNYNVLRTAPSTLDGGNDIDCTMDGKVWVSQVELANVIDVNFLQ